ncbi:MAG: DUF134 domain-containing protein [Patescibacteria group bacterium]
MARPRNQRKVNFHPPVTFFKPAGVPLRQLEIVVLEREEGEALRLRHLNKLEQTLAAKKMQTSQATFGRILQRAYAKLADAMVRGKAIRIE